MGLKKIGVCMCVCRGGSLRPHLPETETHGKFNHPGDLGMEEIAELMWETVKSDF